MNTYCYIGNRVRKGGASSALGITICKYDEETGLLNEIGNVAPNINVGFMFIEGNNLYCTDERDNLKGMRSGGGGQVYSFAIDPATGWLKELNYKPSLASMPNYVVSNGNYLILTNHGTATGKVTLSDCDDAGNFYVKVLYDESSLVLYQRMPDGSIGKALDIWKAQGSGPLDFQCSPHLHSVVVSPSKELYSVCDKGSDSIYTFRILNNRLAAVELFKSSPGFAPRYSVFHPTQPFLFVNNEFQPYIYTFHYSDEGKLENKACTRVLPESISNPLKHGQSDMLVSFDGKYLYVLFRQIDMIFVFTIDQVTGELDCIQSIESEGKNLRAFRFSPDGKFLSVAAVDSNNVLIYRVNPDGTLRKNPNILYVGTNPANLVFYKHKHHKKLCH
jgi:6-phosphogluconolactonase